LINLEKASAELRPNSISHSVALKRTWDVPLSASELVDLLACAYHMARVGDRFFHRSKTRDNRMELLKLE
jgi:hypothetical protein